MVHKRPILDIQNTSVITYARRKDGRTCVYKFLFILSQRSVTAHRILYEPLYKRHSFKRYCDIHLKLYPSKKWKDINSQPMILIAMRLKLVNNPESGHNRCFYPKYANFTRVRERGPRISRSNLKRRYRFVSLPNSGGPSDGSCIYEHEIPVDTVKR